MKTMIKSLALTTLTALALDCSANPRAATYAVQDAAEHTLKALATDPRVASIRSIAFVRLNLKDGAKQLPLQSDVSQIFEATLASKPQKFSLVTHETHADEWKLIDGVFDQAEDFESYDPKTHPELQKLKLADALLFGQIVEATEENRANETETVVTVALRLVRVSTSEQIWGGAIEGRHVSRIDRVHELLEQVKSLLTFQNVRYTLGGLIALIVLLAILRRIIRVR